ncbi:thioredoxin domain-containing protein [Pseudenhygromyxa sp. WMMC2535]|uniref:DsbA family protein n=1 Tax=Pseudenhygromyxa sp. WMMC2535 TaxID=2712867 RepID=UPI00155361B3|nr:thioredoxin domain-containing protein [Pseudenhygromyxa sp. WMMC2535]NVB42635.1 thioredoxin domain-containing protein [Pseudenhygromyxa sp. WMMC2535]
MHRPASTRGAAAAILLTASLLAPGCAGKEASTDAEPLRRDISAQEAARAQALAAWARTNIEGERYLVPYAETDLQRGAEQGALVTIVVFLDYQCPYCARLSETFEQLLAAHPEDLRVVIKHFPLAMHRSAEPAARAVLAAQEQGQGWPLHLALTRNQGAFDDADLRAAASKAGVADLRGFEAAKDQAGERVAADLALGKQLGVNSTPNFFVNGVPHRGAQSFEMLDAIVRDEIEQIEGLLAAGARRDEVYSILMTDATTQREAPAPSKSKNKPVRQDPKAHYALPVDGRPTLGPADALVTIVTFTDFQCPFCRRVLPTLAELREHYGDDLRIVLRHNPLDMHPQAKAAALAAAAADRQGRFWDMHDALFAAAADPGLAQTDLVALGERLGLDGHQLAKDMADPELEALVAEDQALAEHFGARGTPSFFINGRPLSGALLVNAFEALIDEELAIAARFAKDQGVPRDQLYETMRRGWETEVEVPPVADHERRELELAGLPVIGKPGGALTVVACMDFDCPYSARGAATMAALFEDAAYADELSLYFAHYPLPMHETALQAHQAAVAAGNQGAFWPMYDALFANPKARGDEALLALARDLGLDESRFLADLQRDATQAAIEDGKKLCAEHGVSGTPTFFINGRLARGALPESIFGEIFDEELAGGFERAAEQ